VLSTALAGALSLGAVGLSVPASAAVSPDAPIVINEVYGGGGNNGATLTHDFVELVNVSEAPVALDGWTLQYASAGGGFTQQSALSGAIPAGSHFLIQLARGDGGTTSLPTPDATGSLGLGGSAGKVALASDTTAVTGPDAANVVDYVAWGSSAAPAAGGTPAPGTSNTTSVSRDAAHTNTAVNGTDFAAGTPSPQNSQGGAGPEPTPTPTPTDPTPSPTPTDPAVVTVAQIQGTGPASPLVGQTVTTEGVVTAHYPTGGFNGYVIQTAGTGGPLDPATHTASTAVFVFAPQAVTEVALGQTVRVTGAVSEFNGLTELTVGPGNAEVIADAADPLPATVGWPADAAQREALESMLIAPQGAFTVSNTFATNQYGEVGLAAGEQPLRQPTDAAAPGSQEAAAIAADNAARAVTLDDGASINYLNAANTALTPPYVSLTEPVVVGGSAAFNEPLIVDWRNDAWKLNPTRALAGDGSGSGDGVTFANPRTPAPASVGGDVSVASFNVLNYFTTLGEEDPSTCEAFEDRTGDGNNVRGPVREDAECLQRGAWDAEDLERQQNKIVSAITALDASVVGLMEIENSAALGETLDEATATLVKALNSAARSEKWALVPSSAELPDPATQDVITNAIIYQPALVEPVGPSRALGTLSDGNEAFSNAREPIGQVFEPVTEGDPFLFVVNHFKSKGSAGPLPGDQDSGDGQGASNASRVAQATALRDWVTEIQGDTASVILAGDFNSYGREDPLQVLYGAGYADAEASFDLGESSYSFQGLSGSLDHVLLNEAARARATGADIWNINSGESVALEYSRYNYHGTLFHDPGPFRSSDHDPVKVGLAAEEEPVEITLFGINDFHGRITGITPPRPAQGTTPAQPENPGTVGFAGTLEELRAATSGPSLFLSAGDNIGASVFASSVQQDKPTIDVLNALGLQTSAVGNHEFDRGFDDLSGRVEDAADFSHLGANVYSTGTKTPALDEYALLPAGDLVVGVIGAVTEETPTLVSPAGVASLEFGDPVEAVNRVAAQLSDGDAANGEADVLVALYHEGAGAGAPEGATLEEEIAAGGAFAAIVNDTTPDVDAIFTGHTHKEYAWSAPVPGTDRTRPVVQTGSYGQKIGEIVLTVDAGTGEVLAHAERNVGTSTTPAADLIATYPRVAEVDRIVREALALAAEIGDTAVAEVGGDITTAHSGGAFVDGVWTGGARDDRASESALGNLVATSIRETLAALPDGAQIGVTNPGGLRADLFDTQAEFGDRAVAGLPDGTISYSQANAVLPFNNTMALVTLTGEQFTNLLEQQWQRTEDGEVPSRPYLQLGLSDNVTYTYDATRAEGDRITSVSVDGAPLDPAAEYRIGTLSFLATGGDNFRAFLEGTDYVDTGLLDYEAWIDYLADESEETPLTANFAKRAVSVEGLTETVAPGDSVSFSVSNLNMTSLGAPEATELTVSLGQEVLTTVPVLAGTAEVSVALPDDVDSGRVILTLTTDAAGTVVTVPVTVSESEPEPEPGSGAWATVTLSSDRVEQGGRLTVSVSELEPGQQIGATLFSDPIVVTGIPAADAGGRTSFSISIPADFALGAHTLEITSANEAPLRFAVTVVGRGSLAVTGSEFPLGLALGSASLLVAAGVLFTMRRRPSPSPR
jgi:5'-nucleotidase